MAGYLTEKQVQEVFTLMKQSDAVELKVTVPDSNIRSTVDILGLDALNAQLRQIVFFDTPDLDLSAAGVVVRARRIQGGTGDTVVKFRPIDPNNIPDEIRREVLVKVEVDAAPRGFVCSASMRGKATAAEVRNVILHQATIKSIFSKAQRDVYKLRAPVGLKLNDLSILGPINILKLIFEPEALRRKFVAEMWLYPDGSRVLELSTKCSPDAAFQVATETRTFLAAHGVDLTSEQQPKTNKALKYFSSLLKQAAEADLATAAAVSA